MTAPARFDEHQRLYFEDADVPRFLWQTRNPYVAERERALLPRVDLRPADRCVEVGCGEGANLYQLTAGAAGSGRAWIGVDLFLEKVRHAARQLPDVRAVCAKGQQLPFPAATFRHVLSRDIFHHVLDKDALMMELRRVCAAGGTITMIEPNGRNPILWLFALLHRAERDLMAMRPEVLRRLIGADAADLRIEFFDPFPLYRIVFHYRYGLPGLARFAPCRRAVSALERWVGHIIPRERWGYMRATLRLPQAGC
jgi:SAM-dependent methyltransferase